MILSIQGISFSSFFEVTIRNGGALLISPDGRTLRLRLVRENQHCQNRVYGYNDSGWADPHQFCFL